MAERPPPAPEQETFWRDYLTRGDPSELRKRRFYRRLPRDPRCRLCAAPFAGPGAQLMRMIGKRPSDTNPTLCTTCVSNLVSRRGGAEIEATLLFADVRGSTALGERMSPDEFRRTLDRFYRTATGVVFDHDGAIDKYVGDEVMAMFYPLIAGDRHAPSAVAAARALLVATGHDDPSGPWLPLGVGVDTGRAWFGVVGDDRHVELTALGDTVNTTARLAAAAGPGEILVGLNAATAAGLDVSVDRRRLDLKGKSEAVDAISLRVRPS